MHTQIYYVLHMFAVESLLDIDSIHWRSTCALLCKRVDISCADLDRSDKNSSAESHESNLHLLSNLNTKVSRVHTYHACTFIFWVLHIPFVYMFVCV